MLKIAAIPSLVRLHAGDAAFLFQQRRRAFSEHRLGELGLGRLDQRLEANIAGLVAAGQMGWDIALEQTAEFPGAGEMFALAALALATGENVGKAIAVALPTDAGRRGLSGALAWSRPEELKPFLAGWQTAADPALRLLGMIALGHHGHDPGQTLADGLDDPDPGLRRRAARLAFELGRLDTLGQLRALQGDPVAGFWARMALVRFGERREIADLDLVDPGRAGLALDHLLAARPDMARALLSPLLKRPDVGLLALSRAGVSGDRSILSWLVQQMADPALAEAAGFALLDLYPLDITDCGLFSENPAGLGPEFAALDPALLPIAAKVKDWVAAGAEVPAPFVSLRHLGLQAMRLGALNPSWPLTRWRHRRAMAAWL